MTAATSTAQLFDLIVIGGGSGGLAAAEFGATLGAHVALVEAEQRLGGECLHSGCVPSKALIHAARRFQTIRDQLAPWDDLTRDCFKKAMADVARSINQVEADHDNDAYYLAKGVTVYHSPATFSGKKQLQLADGTMLAAKRIIIATGSRPLIPNIPGLADGPFITNENIFALPDLPASLIVIGGGPIGCELGQALAMFGARVTIISQDERLLPRDEPEASTALQAALTAMQNVQLVFNAKITSVNYDDGVNVHYLRQDEATVAHGSHVLVATGRAANTNLNLAVANIACTERAIAVNERLQTSNRYVYAIGDVAGGPNFTHVAVDQAVAAVQNALLGRRKAKRAMNELTWATFTTPEIAHLGADEASLIQAKSLYHKHVIDFSTIDKAVADNESGLIKVLTDDKGLILGATIVGGPASELIGTLALAKYQNVPFEQLGSVLQAYPTYSFGLKIFASGISLQTVSTGYKSTLLNVLRKITLR